MKGGFLLAMLGAWITTQVLGGEALQRLGVLPFGARSTSSATTTAATAAAAAAAASTPSANYAGAVAGSGLAPVAT